MRDEPTVSTPRERRNYYRILNVQPDAPVDIIRSNYRTLLQKLRLHPDLGGVTQQATVINEAYHVLRDPERRTAYDQSLLAKYGIETLSQGNLAKYREKADKAESSTDRDRHGNQRNYYRLLNIQPDAPDHIIKTSYLISKKQADTPVGLLNEAYSVLGNSVKRKLYDRLLTKYSHSDAVELLLKSGQENLVKTRIKQASVTSGPNPSRRDGQSARGHYRPLITQFCQFCKTPHSQSPCEDTAPLCMECDSPLFPPSSSFLEQRRRDIVRLAQRQGKCDFYTRWPGRKKQARIADLSPIGIQIQTPVQLEKDQVLKLDAEDFKAVGVVTHTHRDFDGDAFSNYAVGIKFLTVNFNKLKGQFFSASA